MSLRSHAHSFIFALLLWCLTIAVPSLAADPIARASLQSKGTLYVGQQVLIDVDVLVPNYFLQPPQFPLFDLPGATVALQDGQALNLNETIDGVAYSGIQRTYIVVPQRDGEFTLPPRKSPSAMLQCRVRRRRARPACRLSGLRWRRPPEERQRAPASSQQMSPSPRISLPTPRRSRPAIHWFGPSPCVPKDFPP